MPARAPSLAAAAAAGRPAPVPGRAQARVPYLVRFFSTGYADHTRSAIRIRTESEQTADRKPPRTVGQFLSETNHCNGSDRIVATVQSGTDGFTPPGAL